MNPTGNVRSPNRALHLSACFMLLASACVTSQTPESSQQLETKQPDTASRGAGAGMESAAPAAQDEVAPLSDMLVRASEPGAPLSEADKEQIRQRKDEKAEPGSVLEALRAIVVLKQVAQPLNRPKSAFEETDLTGVDTSRTPGSATPAPGTPAAAPETAAANAGEREAGLEALSGAVNVDIPAVLERNRFLQTVVIHRLTADALARGGNSPAFDNAVRAAIERQINAWRELSDQTGIAVRAGDPAGTTQPDVVTPQAPVTPPPAIAPGAPPPSLADLRAGDDIIAAADAAAGRGEFEAAVTQLSAVTEDAAIFPVARERLRVISNRAVQDLRRRAAIAFQAAAPISDPKSRSIHLEKARELLEEALAKFPAADQLPTVRENLAVISRDLARLAADERNATPPATTAPPPPRKP